MVQPNNLDVAEFISRIIPLSDIITIDSGIEFNKKFILENVEELWDEERNGFLFVFNESINEFWHVVYIIIYENSLQISNK